METKYYSSWQRRRPIAEMDEMDYLDEMGYSFLDEMDYLLLQVDVVI